MIEEKRKNEELRLLNNDNKLKNTIKENEHEINNLKHKLYELEIEIKTKDSKIETLSKKSDNNKQNIQYEFSVNNEDNHEISQEDAIGIKSKSNNNLKTIPSKKNEKLVLSPQNAKDYDINLKNVNQFSFVNEEFLEDIEDNNKSKSNKSPNKVTNSTRKLDYKNNQSNDNKDIEIINKLKSLQLEHDELIKKHNSIEAELTIVNQQNNKLESEVKIWKDQNK